MIKKRTVYRVVRDQEVREHGKDALLSASKAALRARSVSKEKRKSRKGAFFLLAALVLAVAASLYQFLRRDNS